MLAAGRAAFERSDWQAAFDDLRHVDVDASLDAQDLERLAHAALWLGDFQVFVEKLEAAFALRVTHNDVGPAARLAMELCRVHAGRQRMAVAVVRRLPRTMSTPAKLAVATLPIVVAELTVGPLLMPPGGGPADGATGPNRVVPLTLDSERVARRTPPAQPSAGARAPRPPAVVHNPATTASLPPRVHTVLEVNSAAPPVVVSHYSRPEDRITVCTLGQVQICVDRPRPALVPQPKPLP